MIHRIWGALAGIALLLVALLVRPGSAGAQASPLLPPEHWAVEAIWRIEALGLVPGYLPAERSIPRRVAGEVLREAAAEAEDKRAPWADLLSSWVARFQEEFPEAAEPSDSAGGVRLLGSSVAAGYGHAAGRVAPGLGEFPPNRTGVVALPDRGELWMGAQLAARVAEPIAFSVTPRVGTEGVDLPRWEVGAGWRDWGLVVGRGPVGYGAAEGGGVLLSGLGVLDRVELVTTRPFRLPGFLRHLGPVALQTFLAQLPEDRHPGEPVFTGVRLSGRVHPRITLAGQRAALIGGEGTPYPVTFERLLMALVGEYGSIEDQIASVEMRVHLPTERWIPATLYCEWGMEDTSGAFYKVPGILCGTLLPALPRLPSVAVGVERTFFGARCCRNPPWYRHHMFPGSWALEETPLGHPLGGEGSEWLAFARGSAMDASLRLKGKAFLRERTGENLFVPGREGSSLGVGGEAVWRFRPSSEVWLGGSREAGDGWSETRLELTTRILF